MGSFRVLGDSTTLGLGLTALPRLYSTRAGIGTSDNVQYVNLEGAYSTRGYLRARFYLSSSYPTPRGRVARGWARDRAARDVGYHHPNTTHE